MTTTGQNADGSFKTAAAQTYPSGLCRAIAATMPGLPAGDARHQDGPRRAGAAPDHRDPDVPTCAAGNGTRRASLRGTSPRAAVKRPLATRQSWSLVYKGLWRNQEHITVQEMRTAVGVLRHLARSRPAWNHEVRSS